MILLIAVGIAVAVFGALVLLRFPDRPGGGADITFGFRRSGCAPT